LKFFKDDDKERISADSPKEVTLEFVLTEIDKLPTIDGNFIGLINEEEETIQFIRFEENSWLIDVPILVEGTYSYSLQDDDLTTEKVKDIIKRFFGEENWKSICNLRRLQQKPEIEENKRRIECFKELGDEGAEMISEEILSKEEFIKKLEDYPISSNDITYGIIAELSKPFVMIKKPNGKWEVRLDVENPNFDVEISESESEPLDFEEIDDIKKWVNEKF